jgi:hypothetical protein
LANLGVDPSGKDNEDSDTDGEGGEESKGGNKGVETPVTAAKIPKAEREDAPIPVISKSNLAFNRSFSS